ncbi:MAG: amidase, partial [Gammaproteobacteria bacterium]|nr:amidase [Gammaproteobacteria bacterium]
MTLRQACLTLTVLALVPLIAPAHAGERVPATADAQPTAPYFSSIDTLEAQMQGGHASAVTITQSFIRRIHELDRNGPKVNAVIELNPEALAIARRRDDARRNGQAHGVLFGIPVMVKDNIDTADRMQTTAGSLAMLGPPPARDATVVAKLRAAGAVLLGKTNLSEWANFRSTHSSSGWSARGGLTRNPYVLSRSACGSSSGSAAAVAAGFVTVALGTETDGSVICPSATNGIVGIKPTLGLVSRAGIVPISHSQDTAGAMARTVTDAAILLTAIAGSDPRDPATADADRHATDYTRFLTPDALRGRRIGVVRELAGYDPNVDRILDQSVAALRAAGAIVVDPVQLPHVRDYEKDEMTVLLYEFKHDLNAYLATRPGLKVRTLADLIAFDRREAATEMPWFGQDLFVKAQAKGELTDPAYLKALAREKRLSGPQGIDAALAEHHLDALMAPATGPAWTIDLVNGDHFTG